MYIESVLCKFLLAQFGNMFQYACLNLTFACPGQWGKCLCDVINHTQGCERVCEKSLK